MDNMERRGGLDDDIVMAGVTSVETTAAMDPADAVDIFHGASFFDTMYPFDAMLDVGTMSHTGILNGSDILSGFGLLNGVDSMDGLEHKGEPISQDAQNDSKDDFASMAWDTSPARVVGGIDCPTDVEVVADAPDIMEAEASGAVDATDGPNVRCLVQVRTPATTRDWLLHKDTIERLYKVEDKRLEDVMEIMEREHNFHATVNVYKKKLRKWGVKKNFKDREVLAILHTKAAREAVGKESRFTAQGHPVDLHRMATYIKRNPSIMRRFAKGKHAAPSLASQRIVCRTPSPGPSAGLHAAGQMRMVEELLRSLQLHCDGAFDSGHWFLDEDGYCCTRSDSIQHADEISAMLDKLCLWEASGAVDVFRILNPVFETLTTIFKADVHGALNEILYSANRLHRYGHPQLATMLLEYTARLSRCHWKEGHPLPNVWRCITELSVLDNVDILEKVLFLQMDAIQARAGKSIAAQDLMFIDLCGIMADAREYHRAEARLARVFESRQGEEYKKQSLGRLRLEHSGYIIFAACENGQFAVAWDELVETSDLVRQWDPVWEFYFTVYIKAYEGYFERAE